MNALGKAKQLLLITFVFTLSMKRLVALLFCCLWLFQAGQSIAQWAPPERLAWKNLGKEKWTKAEIQLKKALRKDSSNMAVHYVYAWYFFSSGSPSFNTDSAHRELTKATLLYGALSKKERDRWLRFPIDSVILINFQNYIDSAAFERAKTVNSEEAYRFFIKSFPGAHQVPWAVELQYEAAFLNASEINTHQSYLSFLQRYPQSARSLEAQNHYDKLLFEASTKSKQLASYENFLVEHPETPYRREAEKQIFELFTASGEPGRFYNFIENHSDNFYAGQARDMLFHIYKDQEKDVSHILTDSLKQILYLNSRVWFPVWANGNYSFIDEIGNEYLTNVGDGIDRDLVCEGLTQDIVLTNKKLLARNGKIIKNDVIEYKDLGFGFLWVRSANDTSIVYKSGKKVLDVTGKIMLLNNQFFLMQSGDTTSLYTLSGRKILSNDWKEVKSFGNVVAFHTNKGFQLTTNTSLHDYISFLQANGLNSIKCGCEREINKACSAITSNPKYP